MTVWDAVGFLILTAIVIYICWIHRMVPDPFLLAVLYVAAFVCLAIAIDSIWWLLKGCMTFTNANLAKL